MSSECIRQRDVDQPVGERKRKSSKRCRSGSEASYLPGKASSSKHPESHGWPCVCLPWFRQKLTGASTRGPTRRKQARQGMVFCGSICVSEICPRVWSMGFCETRRWDCCYQLPGPALLAREICRWRLVWEARIGVPRV